MTGTETLLDARRPKLLDLFCGAGGASRGYHNVGFEVVGVDHSPQPNFPFEWFVQDDAIGFLDDLLNARDAYGDCGFAAIHASPPCQSFSAYRRKGHGVGDGYPNLIPTVRSQLELLGLPYVIENVPRSPLLGPVTLCGSMFGLDVRRHRLFETNWPLVVPSCNHAAQVARGKRFPGATNREGRFTCEVGVYRIPLATQRAAMGIDWMTLGELSEAIPPAYTDYIGRQLLTQLALVEVAA